MDTNSQENSALKQFLKENKSLTYTLPFLAIMVIAAIIIFSSSSGKKPSDASSDVTDVINNIDFENSKQVEILPQLIRDDNEEKVDVENDPFEAPIDLTGILYSEERPLAILHSDGVSYIVETGMMVGKTSWEVSRIDKESIVLENDTEKITLKISDNNTTQN